MVDDGRMLLAWAARQGVQVPPAVSKELLSAADNLAALEQSPRREEFYSALQQLIALVQVGPAEIQGYEQRQARLAPLVNETQRLLSYAAANGKQIEDPVRKDLVETADGLTRGNLAVAGEERFLKAYQQLTRTLAPVTAETLESSRTRFPKFGLLLTRPKDFFGELAGATGGRFFHSLLFVCVLLATGAVLGYYADGAGALDHYDATTKALQTAKESIRTRQLAIDGAKKRIETAQVEKAVPENLAKAREELDKERSELERSKTAITETADELKELRGVLAKWLKPLCGRVWTGIPCASAESSALIFAARMARNQLAQIVLPMLLGFLGEYTFVLRNMSVDIERRSFAPGSSIHHVIRLFLGAMAGIASGWLLKPGDVGLLSSAPAWVLAFVAGYSVELVFSFMDRIVTAFSTKPA